MVAGLMSTASVALPEWTSSVISGAKCAQSTERRFARWLANEAIDPSRLFAPLISQALRSWGEERITLALDTSLLFEHFCLIRLAVVYRGRAVPLVWRVIDHDSAQVGFDHLEPILAQTKDLLDRLGTTTVLVLADRGFVDTKLMRHLTSCGWDYHIRLKGQLTLFSPLQGKLGKVRDMRLEHGFARFFHDVELTHERLGPIHVALAHPDGARAPWFVVSSQRTGLWTFEEYAARFCIEENFLDDKSGGFGLEDSRLRDAAMLDRLMLVLAVTTLLFVSDATVCVEAGQRTSIDAHRARGLSYFKLGWRSVRRALSTGADIFTTLKLVGGADPAPPRPPTAKRRTPPLHALLHTLWFSDHRPDS